MYNLTVTVTDRGGLTDVASLVVYLNLTTQINNPKMSPFECALYGARTEINIDDKISLMPPLFVLVLVNIYFI
jgi:hypothetical protein